MRICKPFILPTALTAAVAMALGTVGLDGAVTDNLVGHWKLDETNSESLGVVNSAPVALPEDGVRTGTILLDQLSPVGSGYFFDESNNDFVGLGTSVIGELAQVRELSISGWIKADSLRPEAGAGGRQMILGADPGLQFTLQDQGSIVYVFYNEGFVPTAFEFEPKIAAGDFVHVALTHGYDPSFDDMPVRLYINGEMVDEQFRFPAIDNFTFATETPSLNLGRYNGFNDTARDFGGVMSDMGLWAGRVLSQEEVSVIGGMGRAHMDLSSAEIDSVVAMHSAQSGSVTTGDWTWSYTNTFATAADGSPQALGKHYHGQDDNIYVILGGSSGNWSGVTATGGEPFAIPIRISQEPADVAVNLGQSAQLEVAVLAPEALTYQWHFRSRTNAPAVALDGQTAAALTIGTVEATDDGFYFCVATEAGAGLMATSREARLSIQDKPTELVEQWLLNEKAADLTLLDPAHTPEEERVTEAPLVNAVEFGSEAVFVKGTSVEDPAPVFGGLSGSPVSTGSLGSDVVGAHINLGQVAPNDGPFTIALWFKRNGETATGTDHILSSNVFPQEGRWALSLQPGAEGDAIRLFHNSPDAWGAAGNVGNNGFDLTTSFQQNQWYHVAMTRDASDTFKLYLDGAEVFSTTNSGPFTNSVNGVWLGARPESTNYFPGLFDDVRFYDGALSVQEVGDLIGEAPFSIAVTDQPQDQAVNLGETANYSVTVEADGPVDYQWYFRPALDLPATALADATGASLTVSNVQLGDDGFYFCEITETGGISFARTANVSLTILDRPIGLSYHLRLNETAADLPAELDPLFEPLEDRTNEWVLSAAVGANPTLFKGALDNTLPQFGAAAAGAQANGSSGSLGITSDYGRIALGDVAPGVEPFSMAIWFKMDAGAPTVGARSILSSNTGQGGRWNLHVMGGGNEVRFFHASPEPWGTEGNVADFAFDLTKAFQQDRWYHFAMTRDLNGVFKLFLDGSEVFSTTNTGTFSNSGNGVFLARQSSMGGNLSFQGLLDDFRIYDGAIDAAQVLALYEGDGEPAGSYDTWVTANFTETEASDPAVSGPEVVLAGDDVSNLLKYAFGLDPKAPAPREELPAMGMAEGGLTLTYTRIKGATDVAYTVEGTTDLLMTWAPETVQILVTEDRGDAERVTVWAPGLDGEVRGFLRLRVVLSSADL